MLEKSTHRLFIADGFEGAGEHRVRIPYTFPPDVAIAAEADGVWRLRAGGDEFLFIASSATDWATAIIDAEVSPSYGVKHATKALAFERQGSLQPLAVALVPAIGAPPEPVRWLQSIVAGRFPVPGFKL